MRVTLKVTVLLSFFLFEATCQRFQHFQLQNASSSSIQQKPYSGRFESNRVVGGASSSKQQVGSSSFQQNPYSGRFENNRAAGGSSSFKQQAGSSPFQQSPFSSRSVGGSSSFKQQAGPSSFQQSSFSSRSAGGSSSFKQQAGPSSFQQNPVSGRSESNRAAGGSSSFKQQAGSSSFQQSPFSSKSVGGSSSFKQQAGPSSFQQSSFSSRSAGGSSSFKQQAGPSSFQQNPVSGRSESNRAAGGSSSFKQQTGSSSFKQEPFGGRSSSFKQAGSSLFQQNQYSGRTENIRGTGGSSSFKQQSGSSLVQQKPYSGKSENIRAAGGSVSCPEKNGRFPTRTCDGYIECEDGVGEEKTCPDGLLFNPNAKLFSYPCQYPTDVDCKGRETIQAAQPTDECPHQYGYFKLGDRTNCGQFKNCVDGRGFVFDCPEGLAFSEDTYRCEWPDQVSSCDAEAFLGFTCPPTPEARGFTGLGDEEFRYFRSSTDCQKYFVCIKGRPRLLNCGEGKAFNDLIDACDGIENVTGCALPSQKANTRNQPSTFQSTSQFSNRPQSNYFKRY